MAGIPSRSAEVKRDLGAMSDALASRGGGGSASELRSDAGIFFQYGIEETLKRHVDLLIWETVTLDVAPGVGAAASTTFSFPTDTYILACEMWARGDAANLQGASLVMQDPASLAKQCIYLTTPTEETIFAGGFVVLLEGFNAIGYNANLLQNVLPLFAPAGTDFIFLARADAVGAVRIDLTVTVARCPQGVEIPH